MNTNLRHAVEKYQATRSRCLDAAYSALPEFLLNKHGKSIHKSEIRLTTISFQTYEKLKHWEISKKRVAQWDWDKVRDVYRSNPKRFEVAIWHKQNFLCGASVGKPTNTKKKIMLDFIEANPSGSPISGLITDIVIICGQIYGKSIGASELRIMYPISEGVKNHYLSKPGFSYNDKENYCFKRI